MYIGHQYCLALKAACMHLPDETGCHQQHTPCFHPHSTWQDRCTNIWRQQIPLETAHCVPQGVKGSTFLPAICPVAPFHSPTPRLYPQSLCVSMTTLSLTGRLMQISTMPCKLQFSRFVFCRSRVPDAEGPLKGADNACAHRRHAS
jgi:hypothetical protein